MNTNESENLLDAIQAAKNDYPKVFVFLLPIKREDVAQDAIVNNI
jgi:hypothetical protein